MKAMWRILRPPNAPVGSGLAPLVGRALCLGASLCGKARAGSQKDDLSEKKLSRYFVDQRRVKLQAGSGGDGACSFHSEPRKEWGGPDGGDGGNGGDIVIRVDRQVRSLSLVSASYRGEDGGGGERKNCYGRNAPTTFISVPVGTVVMEDGVAVADLVCDSQEFVAARGGAGGKGNRFFLSNERRAPRTATPGGQGQERVLRLELRTVAHAGLVGFPNVGKSSLLRAISNARPAVAPYPFTTLNPHVGVVQYRDHQQLAVADIPGIVVGAAPDRPSLLRHVERCRVLLLVLDMSSSRRPWDDLRDLRAELERYRPGLSRRPHVVVANKMDVGGAGARLPELRRREEARVIALSALTGVNTEELILHLRELCHAPDSV